MVVLCRNNIEEWVKILEAIKDQKNVGGIMQRTGRSWHKTRSTINSLERMGLVEAKAYHSRHMSLTSKGENVVKQSCFFSKKPKKKLK